MFACIFASNARTPPPTTTVVIVGGDGSGPPHQFQQPPPVNGPHDPSSPALPPYEVKKPLPDDGSRNAPPPPTLQAPTLPMKVYVCTFFFGFAPLLRSCVAHLCRVHRDRMILVRRPCIQSANKVRVRVYRMPLACRLSHYTRPTCPPRNKESITACPWSDFHPSDFTHESLCDRWSQWCCLYPVSCRDIVGTSFDDVWWCDSSQILGDTLMFYTIPT